MHGRASAHVLCYVIYAHACSQPGLHSAEIWVVLSEDGGLVWHYENACQYGAWTHS